MCQSGAGYHQVADHLPGRRATQCRYRWEHHKAVTRQRLSKEDYTVFVSRGGGDKNRDPGLKFKAQNRLATLGGKKGQAWTSREEKTLLSRRARGETFTEISKHLPSRTPGACNERHRQLRNMMASRAEQKTIKVAKRLRLILRSRNQPWLENKESDMLDERSPDEEAETLPSEPFDDAETERPGIKIDSDNEPAAASKDVDLDHHDVIILSSDEDSEQDQQPTKAQQNRLWTDLDLNTLIILRAKGEGWEAISKHFTGRTPAACELRYAWYRHVKNAGRRKALISQKPEVRVWRPEDEGVDLLTGLRCDAQVPEVRSTPAARIGDDLAISNMDTRTDSDRSEYYSVRSHNPTMNNSSTNNSSVLNTNAEYTSQPPISPTAEDAISSARFARQILHKCLVKRGEERLHQNTLKPPSHPQRPQVSSIRNLFTTQQQQTTSARYDALEQLRRTHPPLARRVDRSPPSWLTNCIHTMPSENPITTSKN